jgi:tetratricopeptide (TPR) repeat protein
VFDVPALASAQAQLELATACKLRLWRAAPEDESTERRWTVLAFQAVRVRFPGDRAAAAEAAFRAGEVLRAARWSGLAAREFRMAQALGRGTAFPARAGIELGRLQRRAGRSVRALDWFESVVLDATAHWRWREEAALECGRTYAAAGGSDEARRWLRRIAERGEDALLRVRAYDAWALTYVDDGDVEAAVGVLAIARGALAEVAIEETELGRRVASALERMRCIARIEAAVASRRRASARAAKE